MDDEYIREFVKIESKKLSKSIIRTGMFLWLLLESPVLFNIIGINTSPRIAKEEFYQVVKEEKEIIESQKNKIKVKNIEVNINDTIETSHCNRTDTTDISNALGEKEGHNYNICIKTNQLSRFVIRHELDHIYDGHCDYGYLKSKELTKLKNVSEAYFLETPLIIIGAIIKVKYTNEFQASTYALFGKQYNKNK